MVAKKTTSTKKATPKKTVAKKATPVKAVKKAAKPLKVSGASNKKVATLVEPKPKVAKKNPPKEVRDLKELVVRLAYTFIPDVSEQSVADVKNWKYFIAQLDTRLEGHLANILPTATPKEKK